jgi:hypothetical protein
MAENGLSTLAGTAASLASISALLFFPCMANAVFESAFAMIAHVGWIVPLLTMYAPSKIRITAGRQCPHS